MAVSTNLGLYLPTREDYISVSRDLSNNYEIIDKSAGMLEKGIAIVVDGDTAPRAITSGQYLFIKNHSSLATGGYHATANIANGASITSSNVSADSAGVVNAAYASLSSDISALNSNMNILMPPANIDIATLCGRASSLTTNAVFMFAMNSANSNYLVGKTGAGYGIAKVSDDGIRFTYFQPASKVTTNGIIVPATQAVTIYEQYGDMSRLNGLRITNLANNATMTINASGGAFILCTAYNGFLVYINPSGSVTTLAGTQSGITVTGSGSSTVIKNTVGWSLGFVVFEC